MNTHPTLPHEMKGLSPEVWEKEEIEYRHMLAIVRAKAKLLGYKNCEVCGKPTMMHD